MKTSVPSDKSQSNDEVKNLGGRPKETPLRLLENELRSTIKTVRTGREMIETQLALVANHLNENGTMTISDRLEAIERLGTIITNLTKGLEIIGKYSIGDANRRKAVDNDESTISKTSASSDINKILGSIR